MDQENETLGYIAGMIPQLLAPSDGRQETGLQAEEHKYTLKNGTIVSNEYARKRIVSWLRQFDIPLVDRQALALVTIEDEYYARCYVTYIQQVALEIWRTSWELQAKEPPIEETQISSHISNYTIPPIGSKLMIADTHVYGGEMSTVHDNTGPYLLVCIDATGELVELVSRNHFNVIEIGPGTLNQE